MRNLIVVLSVLVTSLFFSSCGNFLTVNKSRTTSLSPELVRLELEMDDFEYLGETKISVDKRRYLGLFKVIDSINNEAFNYQNVRKVNLQGSNDFFSLDRDLKKATYKVIEEYPDASFYIIKNDTKDIHRMFLGRRINQEVVVQAYKFKVEQ